MLGMSTLGGFGGQRILAGQASFHAWSSSSTTTAGAGTLNNGVFYTFSPFVFVHLRTRLCGQQTPLNPPGNGQGADLSSSISKKNLSIEKGFNRMKVNITINQT